ncbi:Aminodeoxychorismate lyase [Rhizina undulata]
MPSESNFSIFSSLRYDPLLLQYSEGAGSSGCSLPCPYYLPTFHRDRMLSAAKYFQWPESAIQPLEDIDGFQKKCDEAVANHFLTNVDEGSALKLKTILSPTGTLTIETTPTPPIESLATLFPCFTKDFPPSVTFTVYLDTEPTTSSPFTSYKTTSRSMYEASRARVGITSYTQPKEVILWNEDGELMEGSVTSVYFFRDGEWTTPPLSSGGQTGTTRRWLLEQGMVKERVVKKSDVIVGETVLLSNGVRGIWAGRVE